MSRYVSFALCLALLLGSIAFPTVAFGETSPAFIEVKAEPSKGMVELSWESISASTIYVYRDYTDESEPVATLKPSETSYTDNPNPGAHNYSIMVVGGDGRIAARSATLPVYIPDECEETDSVIIKLWIGKKEMAVDCDVTPIDTEPVIQQGNTFVSIRPIVEAIGGTIGWDGATKSVTVDLPPHHLSLSIGNGVAVVDGNQKQINENPEIVPKIINGRTMLPFRFVAENLEGEVSWIGSEKRIDIVFPMYTPKAVERAIKGLSSLGRCSLGQIVSIDSVTLIIGDDPLNAFIEGAKVLVFDGDRNKAIPLMDYTDVIGRPLNLTNLTYWLEPNEQGLQAFDVSCKSNMSNMSDFHTVVLVTDNKDIVDATFMLAGFDIFGKESQEDSLQYDISLPIARIDGSSVAWSIRNIPMYAKCEVVSVNVPNPPGCEVCSLAKGDFELSFTNHSEDNTSQAVSISLTLLSSLVDFSFDIGGDNTLSVSLEDGCGFFPGSSCPGLEDQFTNIGFEMIDLRPVGNTSRVTDCSSPVNGFFSVKEAGTTSWNMNSKSKTIGEDILNLEIENSPKPRYLNLNFMDNDHYFGSFKVFALPKNIPLTPNPMLRMNLPILNSPAGKQIGSLCVNGKADLIVRLPHGRPAGWMINDDSGEKMIVSSHNFKGKTSFDCPCGVSKALEKVTYETVQEDGVGTVSFQTRINSDIAFNPKNSNVELQLLRDDEVVNSLIVDISNPEVIITDDTAEPGISYSYCVELLRNGISIEDFCLEADLTPNPWLFEVNWSNSPGLNTLDAEIMRGTESTFDFEVANLFDDTIQAQVSIGKVQSNWDVSFIGSDSPAWLEVESEESVPMSVSVMPNESVPAGENCAIDITIQSGVQIRVITINITVTAPNCSYEVVWDGEGASIRDDVNPGTDIIRNLEIKNTSSRQQGFIIDYDVTGNTSGSQIWTVGFKGYSKGDKIFISTDDSIIIPISASPPKDTSDGESIKVKVNVIACGETKTISWNLTCKLLECTFELEWLSDRTTSTVETEDNWFESFRIWNFGNIQSSFTLEIEVQGEPIIAYLDMYDASINSGEFIDVRVSYQIPPKSRIGESTVVVTVDCGKTTKTLEREFNIKKRRECRFKAIWFNSQTEKMSVDMIQGNKVYLPIIIKNESKTAQLFAVRVERTDDDWMTGFKENKLKQTFTLNPGEETYNLIIWVEGSEETKPGDTCRISVRLNACSLSKTLVCNVTCVEEADLDVTYEATVTDQEWKRNGMLEVFNRITFLRQGVGEIRMTKYGVTWYDADNSDAYIGEKEVEKKIQNVYVGMPSWNIKYYVPVEIIDRLKANGGKRIKARFSIKFEMTDAEDNVTFITRDVEVVFTIPD